MILKKILQYERKIIAKKSFFPLLFYLSVNLDVDLSISACIEVSCKNEIT